MVLAPRAHDHAAAAAVHLVRRRRRRRVRRRHSADDRLAGECALSSPPRPAAAARAADVIVSERRQRKSSGKIDVDPPKGRPRFPFPNPAIPSRSPELESAARHDDYGDDFRFIFIRFLKTTVAAAKIPL